MPYPSTAGVVVLWGSWFDEATRGGMDATMTATPLLPAGSTSTGTPNLTEAASWSWIKARTWTTKPLASGLYAFPLIANDDPDLTAFGGYRIDAQGEQPFIVNITATAATITVTNELADALAQCASLSGSTLSIPVGSTVQAIHLTDAAVLSNPAPQPPSAYYTQAQTNSVIASAIAGLGGGGGSSLVPTSIFTTNSHVPITGEFARYNPSSNLSINLPTAAAGQRFGMANVSTGSSTLTFNRQGSDTFSDGSTSLVLAPGERAVLIGASGGFTIESRTVLSSGSAFTQRSSAATANTTAADNEIVPANTSGGTFTITGPTSGKPFGVRWRTGTAAPTVAAPTGYTINGAASITMGLAPSSSQGELVTWAAVGTDYQPFGGFKPQSALDQRLAALTQWAGTPDALIVGTITRNSDGAATSAPVVWPDGSPGTYTATTVSTAFPGAVDAYTVTYGSPVTKTYTQPAVTRNANGAVTTRPAITAA